MSANRAVTRDVIIIVEHVTQRSLVNTVGGRTLPVVAADLEIGRAVSCDSVAVEGVRALLYHARLARPAANFRQRADGTLVGGLQVRWSAGKLFPTAITVCTLEVST
ncbi:MAG: hypothetical protein IT381_10440 [Deltaproteobacteria bacterium]|nr:hypothetical protein [Deltaproteobacteria bacterium]